MLNDSRGTPEDATLTTRPRETDLKHNVYLTLQDAARILISR
jgi:hypothetical protein